ncbi:hypothetical protein D9R06_09925 [Kocuria marina subsp. indica]|uniref:hypothetical protein n=1 Tax=Kocuria marina TaxID=223184 RepID=UPI000EF24A2C|nr:hypothetical protein [Kocuria indica]RLP57289.1 hypothetical protein D9R06_09925 [Kocuria indica]
MATITLDLTTEQAHLVTAALDALHDLYADELAAPMCRGKAAAEVQQSITRTTELLAVIQDTTEKQVNA